MPDSQSCLISKFSYYIELNDGQEKMLAKLEKSPEEYPAGREIYAGGDRNQHLHVVKSGWLYGYTHLPDGGRHVVRFYHPGDIVGLPGLAFRHHHINLKTATDACLCPFEKQDLDDILENAPTIAALLFTLSSREQVILIDTLRASSRMRPRPRLAFLFLDILSRLRVTNPAMTNRMNMPLTQTDIGDAIGLTNVTVSRTLAEMEDEGLIERPPGELVLRNENALREICDFTDRHSDMDTSWFPGQ